MFQKDFFKEEHLDGKDRETDCAGRIEHDADLAFVFNDRLRWENYNDFIIMRVGEMLV